jgi:hypothetical protein
MKLINPRNPNIQSYLNFRFLLFIVNFLLSFYLLFATTMAVAILKFYEAPNGKAQWCGGWGAELISG